jgi:hypothetical protein
MKLIITFFSFLLVLGFSGLFVLKKPDGTTWLTLDTIIPALSFDSIKESVGEALPDQIIGGNGEQVMVYKWKDAEGNWQFSDKPPEEKRVEQVMLSTRLNRDLVPALKTVNSSDVQPDSDNKTPLMKQAPSISPTTIAPGKISKLIDDARNVQTLMNDRQAQLEASQ